MGKDSGAPAAPDPEKTAAAQSKYNRADFDYMLNQQRVKTNSPIGTTSWNKSTNFDQAGYDSATAAYRQALAGGGGGTRSTFDPGENITGSWAPWMDSEAGGAGSGGFGSNGMSAPNRSDFESDPQWEMNQQFSPENQQLYDQLSARLNGITGSGPDGDYEKAAYDRMRRLQDPQADLDRKALEQRLAERGFQVQNEGYGSEMGRFESKLDESRLNSANQAYLSGAAQKNSDLQANSNVRAQLLAQLMGQGGTSSTPTLGNVDYTGLVNNQYNAQVSQANADAASGDNLFGSLLGLGGMALGAPQASVFGGIAKKMGFY